MEAVRRTVAATSLATAGASGSAALLASLHRLISAGLTRVDDVVAAGVQAIGGAILLWYLATALVALVCLAARAAGAVWVTGEHRLARAGAPLARRLLGAGAGVAVAAAAVVAPAAAVTTPAHELDDDLGWGAAQDADEPADDESSPVPSEDRTPEGPSPQTPSPDAASTDAPPTDAPSPDAPPSQAPPSTTPGSSGPGSSRPSTTAPATAPDEPEQTTYVVVDGDNLWAIAAEHLPASADDADIAATWPDWYELNRDVIGSDPDLIHPGQVLVAPDHHSEEDA